MTNGSVTARVAFLVALASLVGACGSGGEDEGAAETTTTAAAAEVAPTTVAPVTTAAPVATAPAKPVLMPAIPCGTDLQVAQDRVQEAGVFLSRSEDATGQGRNQVVDSNWTVLRHTPPAGTPIEEGDPVFYVVKDDEFSGC
jgi:hypothetical protein